MKRRLRMLRSNNGVVPVYGQTANWVSSPERLLPPGFSLTRASTGTYFDSAGLLQTAAIDAVRGTYRYNGSEWVFDGTLNEAAATNLFRHSNNFNGASWLSAGTGSRTQNATGIDGSTSAWTITDSDAGASYYIVSSEGNLTSATYSCSFYVKKTTGAQSSYPIVALVDITGTKIAAATIDTSNGVATCFTSYTAYTIAAGATAQCVNHSADKWKIILQFTASTNEWFFYYFPAATANPTKATGSAIDEPALTGSSVIERGMLLLGAWGPDASYIDNNTGTSTARSADVLTAPTSGLLVNAQGFAAIGYRAISSATSSGNIVGATTGGIPIYVTGGSFQYSLWDGTAERTSGLATVAAGTAVKVASTWGGSASLMAKNGVLGSAAGFDGSEDFGATLEIGGASTVPFSMVFQSLRLGIRAATNVELGSWTV